jgi:hypothetical protein
MQKLIARSGPPAASPRASRLLDGGAAARQRIHEVGHLGALLLGPGFLRLLELEAALGRRSFSSALRY